MGVRSVQPDGEIIASSLSDPEAFAEIFERHFDAIYWFLARRVGAELSNDLAADVFLAAFECRKRYDPRHAEALPWLYGIATNKLRRHRRTEERRLRAIARTPVLPEIGEEILIATDQAVAAALGSLETRDRETLLLFAWADLGYCEIATALDIPIGTVRSRLNRARRVLRAALEPSSYSKLSREVAPWTN